MTLFWVNQFKVIFIFLTRNRCEHEHWIKGKVNLRQRDRKKKELSLEPKH